MNHAETVSCLDVAIEGKGCLGAPWPLIHTADSGEISYVCSDFEAIMNEDRLHQQIIFIFKASIFNI